jgi:hypothetical protein
MAKTKITQEEYEKIVNQALAAQEILEDERFQFLRDYFQSTLDYVQSSILNNTIRAADEEVVISEKIKRIFHTPKKIQVDELVGQYKLVNKFFEDLAYYARLKKELDAHISKGIVKVDDGKL